MQVPRPEQRQVDGRSAHFGAVHAHQPRPGLAVSQHETVAVADRLVAQPPVGAGLVASRTIAAVPPQPKIRPVSALHRADLELVQRSRGTEEPLRIVQPPTGAVILECRQDLGVDALERLRIADRTACPQAEQDDLVAQGLCGQRDSGPRDRHLLGPVVEIVAPRPRVVPACPGQRSDDVAHRGRPRHAVDDGTPRWPARSGGVAGFHLPDASRTSGTPTGVLGHTRGVRLAENRHTLDTWSGTEPARLPSSPAGRRSPRCSTDRTDRGVIRA